MYAVIFGRAGCPQCARVKELAEKVSKAQDNFEWRYVDIHADGVTRAALEQAAGKPIETVPQIFVDQKHIGSFNEFDKFVRKQFGRVK
ncbi:glutaredoxin 1 [Phytobacter palmae]|uniref:GrxA family glutaredoxin n=1 Tax=Phytobacter palmae TaxID=1855371 RepID=A0ABU9V4X4_9ENTR|nr:GrxA family glutaredoxin [Escherichia coli]SFF03892.1 glutaredoxin 1 [Phytobacter palmae]